MTTTQATKLEIPSSLITQLSELYETDETAWLDTMSQLAAHGRIEDLDCPHLSEYLADMARRDRREVASRFVVLLAHMLKWQYQQDRRSVSWQTTILEQRFELRGLVESGTLFNHALSILPKTYTDAIKLAAAETGLSRESFPAGCPWTLDDVLADADDAE